MKENLIFLPAYYSYFVKNVDKEIICFDNIVSFYKVISASSGLQSPRDRLHAMAFDLAQRYSPCMGQELMASTHTRVRNNSLNKGHRLFNLSYGCHKLFLVPYGYPLWTTLWPCWSETIDFIHRASNNNKCKSEYEPLVQNIRVMSWVLFQVRIKG